MKYLKYLVFLVTCAVASLFPKLEWHLALSSHSDSRLSASPMEGLSVQDRQAVFSHSVDMGLDLDLDFPVTMNDRVAYFVDYYLNEDRYAFSTYLKRSTKYVGLMRKILQKHGLPQDLVYLVLVESGFDPLACSPAQAMGLWQFLDGTASIYGLMRNTWIDERRDPIKSTEAAAKYLKDLHSIFHDWFLVLAAYNTGQYRVLKAIFEAESRDYWVLDLPAQTEDFVPRFLAATIIAKDPESYGFHVRFEKPIDHEVILVDHQADLRMIADCVECDLELLQELNPELVYSLTPPHEQVYPLKIPKGTMATFSLCYEKALENRRLTAQTQDWLMEKSNVSVFF